MKIISKEIEIPLAELSSQYVESELEKRGITPLRWAIVKKTENILIVSVSYQI